MKLITCLFTGGNPFSVCLVQPAVCLCISAVQLFLLLWILFFSSMNHHLIVVEESVCSSDPGSYVVRELVSLVQSSMVNWFRVRVQTKSDAEDPR